MIQDKVFIFFKSKGYNISKDGIITGIHGKILKPGLSSKGYLSIGMYNNHKQIRAYIHRLLAFEYIENPYNLPQVNHKDGNKLNNHLSNLEWVSCKSNIKHAYDSGLKVCVNRKKVLKIVVNTMKVEQFISVKEASNLSKITQWTLIRRLKSGAIIDGVKWEYAPII
jgi:hypothetical protein